MKNVCFISYRHPGNEKTAKTIRSFAQKLESRICFSVAGAKVYLDEEKLRLGDMFRGELAEEMCQSACMVLLYNRSYFDLNHHFCAREYQAMLRIEERRLALNSADLRNKGLILTVAIRDPAHLPEEIRDQRHFLDVSKLMLAERALDDKAWLRKLDEIAEVVADRYWALQELPGVQSYDCGQSQLPAFAEIEPWLRKIVAGRGPVTMPGH